MKKKGFMLSLLALSMLVPTACGKNENTNNSNGNDQNEVEDLNELKQNAIASIDSYLESKLNEESLEDEDNTISSNLSTYKDLINSTNKKETIDSTVISAKAFIDSAVANLLADVLNTLKEEAKEELNNYLEALLEEKNVTKESTITAALFDGESKINLSSKVSMIDTNLNEAKFLIDEAVNALIKENDSASLEAEKEEMKQALEEYTTLQIIEHDLNDADFTALVSEGKLSIDSATTSVMILQKYNVAKELIDAKLQEKIALKNLQNAKTTGITEIRTYAATSLSSIGLTSNEDITIIISNYEVSINQVSSIELVASIVAECKNNIDSKISELSANINLDSAKESAISEIELYASNKMTDNQITSNNEIQAIVSSTIVNITTATTTHGVSEALTNGKVSIDSKITEILNKVALQNLKVEAKAEIMSYTNEVVLGLEDSDADIVYLKAAEHQALIDSKTSVTDVEAHIDIAKAEILALANQLSNASDAEKLEAAKTSANSSLENYAQGKLLENGVTDDNTVAAIVLEGKNNINNATSINDVNTALENAKNSIDSAISILKVAKDLADAKTVAISELNAYKTTALGSLTDDGTVGLELTNGINNINNATSINDVNIALADAKAQIDSKVSILNEAKELQIAKTLAISELETYASTALGTLADDGSILAALNAGKASINNATSNNDVNAALINAKSEIDEAVAILQASNALATAKVNALADLAAYKASALGALTDDGTVELALVSGNTNINAATTEAEVQSALSNAKNEIDIAIAKIKDEALAEALAQAKATAIESLNTYYFSVISGITDDGTVLAAKENGINNINSSTSENQVTTALNNAKESIDSAIETIMNEVLVQAKAAAKAELSSYAEAELLNQGKQDNGTVAEVVLEWQSEIDEAITTTEVQTVLANAKTDVYAAVSAISSGSSGSVEEENTDVLTYWAGLNESIALEWNDSRFTETGTTVYYKSSNSSTYIEVDEELVRTTSNGVRTDILGISEGTYSVKLECGSNTMIKNDITVAAQDRSGYAHYKATAGVGGYNDDGTVKSNAVIVYVTEETKNTVTAKLGGKTYTGLANILNGQANANTPLIVRIVGQIATPQWNPATLSKTEDALNNLGASVGANISQEQIINAGINTLETLTINGKTIEQLNGLDNRVKYSSSELDSYFNTMFIKNADNITLEGVGTDAIFYQWGLTWKNCSYVEVKNLTFDDYPEDACAFEGPDTSVSSISSFTTGHIWIHNNSFNQGKNNWDVTAEQDKAEGDGATDLKGNIYITLAYNHYYMAHKTGLVGGSDSVSTSSITFHHNYYDTNGSRLPLGRQANMHMYNNYYYNSTGTNMSLRAKAYALIENCYFDKCKNPLEIKSNAVAKGIGNVVTGCSGSNGITTVSSRTQIVSNSNPFSSDFDTNSSTFYYDDVNKVSDVQILHTAEEAKEICKKYSGVLKSGADAYPAGAVSGGSSSGGSTGGNTGGSTGEDNGNTGDNVVVGTIAHNFTTDGLTSDVFTITGTLSSSKGSVTYGSVELTQALKMESTTSVSFSLSTQMSLTLVFGGSTDAVGKFVKIDGTKYTVGSDNILTVTLDSGSHTITKGDSINLFYLALS